MDKELREVAYYEYDWGKRPYEQGPEKKFVGFANFHAWGVNYQEFDAGPGNYSTAIIERPDGVVLSLPVGLIRFVRVDKKQKENEHVY